jgi:hypothetical protein
MAKSEEAKAREQRLAAKLRENLKRRKGQAKARRQGATEAPPSHGRPPPAGGRTD